MVSWDEYDERQMLARGQAFRAGFLASLAMSIVVCLAAGPCRVPLRPGSFCFLSLLVWPPVTVFSVSAIRNGAFEGSLRSRSWLTQRMFLPWGVGMVLAFGYLTIAKGGYLDGTGWLRPEVGGLVGGLCSTVIGVAGLAHEKSLQEQAADAARHMGGASAKAQAGKRLVVDLAVGALAAVVCVAVSTLLG